MQPMLVYGINHIFKIKKKDVVYNAMVRENYCLILGFANYNYVLIS